jgi:dienelactone hydrolase
VNAQWLSLVVRCVVSIALWIASAGAAIELAAADDLAAAIRALDARVVPAEQAGEVREVVRRDVRARIKAAEDRESAAWYKVKTREDWESFRRTRIEAMARALHQVSDPAEFEPRELRTTKRFDGDGFTIENITFRSRPDVLVTGNLYRPKTARGKQPGFVICHSHHAPKTQGELQDMGMTWARQGCAVLVVDLLGHGERRTHEFGTAGKYKGDYKPSRQDYYFRYNTGLQLATLGESLLGWIVHDLRCGVTLLGTLPEVDREKIVLLGAVAGGGDPAGVAGALDQRIAAVVPFNFGGYEPEDGFPLPDDAEKTFRYSGGSDWESTRCQRLFARDGFMPWTIIASAAPRRLVYAHEFRWDEPRDPVWKRLNTVFGFYDAKDRLGTIVGHGGVRQTSAEASHCTNIGPVHRAQLYPLLERWFGLPVPQEYSQRLEPEHLRALPADAKPVALHDVLRKSATAHIAAARRTRSERQEPDVSKLRSDLRKEIARLVGGVEPVLLKEDPPLSRMAPGEELLIIRLALIPKSGQSTPIPTIVLRRNVRSAKESLVIAVAQGGKEKLLKDRAELWAACIAKGATVVVCDLRGTGETEPRDEGRGRTGGATSRSVTEQMLGETTLAGRVRDLRSIIAHFRSHEVFRDKPIALYGDGLVAANDPTRPIAAPLDAADLPKPCEPLGADVCLLAGMFEDDITAIYTSGGLVSNAALLDAPYFYVPHDAIVPGLAAVADLPDLLAAQTARVWTSDLRDGANHAIDDAALTKLRQQTADLAHTHRSPLKADERRYSLAAPTAEELAAWLLKP